MVHNCTNCVKFYEYRIDIFLVHTSRYKQVHSYPLQPIFRNLNFRQRIKIPTYLIMQVYDKIHPSKTNDLLIRSIAPELDQLIKWTFLITGITSGRDRQKQAALAQRADIAAHGWRSRLLYIEQSSYDKNPIWAFSSSFGTPDYCLQR